VGNGHAAAGFSAVLAPGVAAVVGDDSGADVVSAGLAGVAAFLFTAFFFFLAAAFFLPASLNFFFFFGDDFFFFFFLPPFLAFFFAILNLLRVVEQTSPA
jgi:hypothetical protein